MTDSDVYVVYKIGNCRRKIHLRLKLVAKIAKTASHRQEMQMKTITAKEAKNGFGRLIDNALAEPIAVAKHGRPVVVVLSIEEYERLKKPNSGGSSEPAAKKGQRHVS